LTIESVFIDEDEDILYTLKIPNKEVRISLSRYIIRTLYEDTTLQRKTITKALRKADMQDLKEALTTIFASIPYNHYTKQYPNI